MKTLAIIGSGDLGQQIAHFAISDKHYDDVVFFDDFSKEKAVNGFSIIGNSDSIENEFSKNSFDELIIGIGYNHIEIRKKMYQRFDGKVPFGKIIHSTSWIDKNSKIGVGCVIYPSCSVDSNVVIENNIIINIGCVIAHDTRIQNHCFLSPRVALAGFIDIEEQCIIGINTTIIDNIKVKAKTIIGGGTVVIKNIEKAGLYVGNPHKFIR